MERMNTVHLVFFSGTGGTARVAANLEQAFLQRGLTVTKTELGQHRTKPERSEGLPNCLFYSPPLLV